MIQEIINRLSLVFDEVTHVENSKGLTITIKHKGKSKVFEYATGTYEVPFSQYNEANKGVKMQCNGMIVDCLDEWGKS